MTLNEIDKELHNPIRHQMRRVVVMTPFKPCYQFVGCIVECDFGSNRIKVSFSPQVAEWYQSEDLAWE